MSTLVTNGAHERLQQLPPHVGSPPSGVGPASAPAPQTSPETVHPPLPGADGTEHVPSVRPFSFVHRPPQHSTLVLHTSPVCVQNDGLLSHVPFAQSFEQHSALPVHVLPEVRHDPLSGVHVLPPPSPPAAHL